MRIHVSYLILLFLLFTVVIALRRPAQRERKPKVARGGGITSRRKPGNVASGRFDDDDDKPLDPLEPAGDKPAPITGENKPSPEVVGETSHVTGSCKSVCVPYYLCNNDKIVDDGSGLIDPRTKPAPRNEIPLDAGKSGICGTFETCCSDPKSKPDAITEVNKKYVHRCGIRYASGINSRILKSTGKGESEFGEWPWQAAILKAGEGEDNLFACGGVLINELYVVTVAHCVVNYYPSGFNILKVRLGEWDTQNTDEFLPHDDYKVVDMIIHEEYRNSSLWNDIALLRLDRKVKFQLNIDTICLPNPEEIFENNKCVTTGWGKDAYQGGSYSNILKEVSLPVVPHQQCQQALRSTRVGPRFKLHPSFICAGGEAGVDSCKGDGGGPLACYRPDGTYALAGIVSWGIECGKPGVPGVYVDIRKYLQWIYLKTGLDSRAFKPSRSG